MYGIGVSMDVLADEKGAKAGSDHDVRKGSIQEAEALEILGYKPELQRNRSLFTLLFQSLAIAAIPYGEGGITQSLMKPDSHVLTHF